MQSKQILRKTLQEKRKRIPAAVRHAKSRRIFRKLSAHPIFRRAVHVALYYGIAPEVATRHFLGKLLKSKQVYLPRVIPKGRNLVFCRVKHLVRELKKNSYDIREPKVGCPERDASKMDLFVVPGVGFDRSGRRLGRGGGYYDRALRAAPKVPKIGLCFREQLIKKIPVQRHDIRMDKVITD
jgi:5-formyltetrahydrofolate cyclo-ligase